MQKKVLLAFDDPGGGLAVIALLDRLSKEDLKLVNYAGKHNEKKLMENNVRYEKLESMITKEFSKNIMNKVNPDILITGTSGGNAEQELRNTAYEKKIKSIVLLDFWKDYSRRWMYSSYEIGKLHDKVCIMDEITKKEMMEEGFPESKLIVTGNPYLDKIFNYEESITNSELIKSKREKFLFLSQPLHIIGIKNYKIHPLEILLISLGRIADNKNSPIGLTVKLHPLEEKSDIIIDILKKYNSGKVNVSFTDDNKSLIELFGESDAVIGYNTIALFEARACNKRAISLQVVPVKDSLTQAMKTAGIEIVKSCENEIIEYLTKDFNNPPMKNIFRQGIENCVKVILQELNMN